MAAQTEMTTTPKTLVLGSGAARGMTHIGVIRALENLNIRPERIVGTSMGAIVGAAYSAGRLDEFSDFLSSLDWKAIVSYCDFTFPQQGLLDGSRITEKLKEILGDITFDDLSIPFHALATDMQTGDIHMFNEGKLIPALRASYSVPGILKPAEVNGRYYLDGGLVAPLPLAQAIELGADSIIAVDLNHDQISRNHRKRQLKRFRRSDILAETTRPASELDSEKASIWNHVGRRYKTVEQSMRLALYNMVQGDSQTENKGPNIFDVLGSSMSIMEHNLSKIALQQNPPDYLIQPSLAHLNFFDFDSASEAINAGYRAAMEVFDKDSEISHYG